MVASLEVPFSLSQTPVSGISGHTSISTGAFFGTQSNAAQPEMQGAHNLVSGAYQAGGYGIVIASAAVLALALLAKRGRLL